MKSHHGFTAVELLITMIIGSLLLLTAYQLYTFVLNDSADTRMRATASNLAYRFMREGTANAPKPCTGTPAPTNPAIPSNANLPNASAIVTITCINTGVVTITYISSNLTYGNGMSITHATYAKVE